MQNQQRCVLSADRVENGKLWTWVFTVAKVLESLERLSEPMWCLRDPATSAPVVSLGKEDIIRGICRLFLILAQWGTALRYPKGHWLLHLLAFCDSSHFCQLVHVSIVALPSAWLKQKSAWGRQEGWDWTLLSAWGRWALQTDKRRQED